MSGNCAGAAEAVATSVLQQLLNPQDAVLGPWIPRRDPLEDALNSFVGSAGGPSPHPWEAGMGFSAGYSGASSESLLQVLQLYIPVAVPMINPMTSNHHGILPQSRLAVPNVHYLLHWLASCAFHEACECVSC